MDLPSVKQPDLNTIAGELTAYQAWAEAWYRKTFPRPELPKSADEPSTATILAGVAVRSPLMALGWFARKLHFSRLRQWCALTQVRLDWMVLCRAGCSLNDAFTELGLAGLAS